MAMNKLVSYVYSISLGLFWSVWVLISQISIVIKNGLSYFKTPKQLEYPSNVFDAKYGKSCIKELKTTKGQMESTTLKLHYVISGESNRETMVLLHGFPEFWFSWRHQITEFSKTFRVIAMDMRGYGLSDKPSNIEDYQIAHIVNDIKALLDNLGIRQITLVAHDWGGAIGWCFESSYPDMVKKYITLNIPHPQAFRKVLQSNFRQFLKSWYISFFQLPYLPEWIFSRLNYQGIVDVLSTEPMGPLKTKMTSEEIEAFRANISQKGSLSAAINYYRASLRFPFSRIKLPPTTTERNRFMLIFGEADGAIEVAAAMETKALIPSLTLKLLPGLSHWVQQDDPALVNRLMRDFINNVDLT